MDITDIIPESVNDIGAIVFWIIIFILIIAIAVLYLYAKRMSRKVVRIQQDLNAHLNVEKQSKEKRKQDLADVKNKVNKILEDEEKKP